MAECEATTMSLEQGSHLEQYMCRRRVEYTKVDNEHVCVVYVSIRCAHTRELTIDMYDIDANEDV